MTSKYFFILNNYIPLKNEEDITFTTNSGLKINGKLYKRLYYKIDLSNSINKLSSIYSKTLLNPYIKKINKYNKILLNLSNLNLRNFEIIKLIEYFNQDNMLELKNKLYKLNVSNNYIDKNGIIILLEFCKNCSQFTTINIKLNNINKDDLNYILKYKEFFNIIY